MNDDDYDDGLPLPLVIAVTLLSAIPISGIVYFLLRFINNEGQ